MSPPQPPRPRGMPLAGSARGPGHFAAACTGCPRSRCASADAQAGFDEAQRVLSDDLTGAEWGKRACGAMIKRDEELLALQGLLLFNAEGRLLINDRIHSDTQRNQMDADLSAAHHEREKVRGGLPRARARRGGGAGRRVLVQPNSDTLNAQNDAAWNLMEICTKTSRSPSGLRASTSRT